MKNYREGKGMPLRAKVFSLSMMWVFVFYAIFFALATKLLALKIIVFLAALIGTKIIFNLPTR